ncbi:MAG: OadG family protein [Clostridia bacterium]|nr:OadG family protein [Clostridia bacterium]
MNMFAVAVIGIIIVFLGLVCLIAIVSMMGMICKRVFKDQTKAPKTAPAAAPTAPAAPAVSQSIPNRDELIVAFSAAVAEELGTDVSAIRVVSLKEIK